MQDANLDPDSCPPPMCVEDSPFRCTPTCQWPDVCHWPPLMCESTWQDLAAREVHAHSQDSHSCLWARFSPISYYWLALLGSPAAISSLLCACMLLLQPTSQASTAMHLWREHGTTGVHAHSLGSCSFMWVQIWPCLLPLACTVRLTCP